MKRDQINEDAPATLPVRKNAWWRSVPWFFVAAEVIGLIWIRWFSDNGDNGFTNVLSYMLVIGCWFFSVLGLMFNTSWRVWLTAAVAPFLAGAIFLSCFRIDRVDAEILPQVSWRWSPKVPLPEGKAVETTIDISRFAARESDYSQFLGKYRDASVANLQLETNWETTPPKILWKQPIGLGWSGFSVQGDAAYTMEQREEEEWVSCYDTRNGELIWKYVITGRHFHPLGGTGPRTTPTLHDGKAFALSAISQFVCLDLTNGKKLWSVELNEKCGASQTEFESEVAWGRSGSPLVVDDKVIVPLGGAPGKTKHSLIALSVETGEEIWRGGDDQVGYASPTLANLDGTQQVLTVSEHFLSSHAIADGKTLWSVAWPSHSNGDANVSQPIAIDSSRVLISKGYGGGAQLLEVHKEGDQWTTKSLWKSNSVLKTKFTSCVVRGEFAYGLSDGTLECVDLATGKKMWKKGRFRHGQLMLVGADLLITAESGELVIVAADSKEFRQLASLPVIGDVTWNTPALFGNRLLMRNATEAACIELPCKDFHAQ